MIYNQLTSSLFFSESDKEYIERYGISLSDKDFVKKFISMKVNELSMKYKKTTLSLQPDYNDLELSIKIKNFLDLFTNQEYNKEYIKITPYIESNFNTITVIDKNNKTLELNVEKKENILYRF